MENNSTRALITRMFPSFNNSASTKQNCMIIISRSILLMAMLLCYAIVNGQFFVLIKVTPMRGPIGSEVRIYASTFDTSLQKNLVYFGAAKAKVLGFSTFKGYITVQVPPGATYAPITVIQNRYAVSTSQKFEVSFPDSANLSEGSLAIPETFHTTGKIHCEKMVLADFDLDGKVDVATLGYTPQTSRSQADISIFKNVSTVNNIQLNFFQLYHIDHQFNLVLKTADIDGDGKLDIIASGAMVNDRPSFLVFRNRTSRGNIAFESPKAFSLPGNGKINIGDINVDGKPDVVYLNADSVYLLKNKSQNAILLFDKPANLNVKGGTAIEIGDYNNDKKVDFAVYNARDITTNFYQNLSHESIVSMGWSTRLSEGSPNGIEPYFVSGDYTGDGWMDLAFLYKSSKAVIVIRNKRYGDIGMERPLGYPINGGDVPSGALALSDLTGDGKPELIVGNRNGSVAAFQNAMKGDVFLFRDPLYFDAPESISDMAVVDVNGDGKLDIVTANEPGNFISVIKNQVGRSKAAPRITSFSPTAAIVRDTVIVTGRNFTGARNVRFGGKNALSYSILSDSVIAAVVDSGASGAVTIVTNYGTASKQGFTYLTSPVIQISTDSLSVCSATPVKIAAQVYGRYPSYSYLWYKNGQRVGGITQPYSTTRLEQGDSVWAVLTNDRRTYESNVLVFDVTASMKPIITITASKKDAACKDSAITFKASVRNGDSSQGYQWMKNDKAVGTNSSEYTDRNLSTGDSVYCILKIAHKCTISPVTSNKLGFTVYNSKPSTPIAIIGPDAVNAGETNIVFSANPPAGAASYLWRIPSDAVWVSGKTNDSIWINWGNNAGKISVKAVNACGFSAAVTKNISLIESSEKIAARSMKDIKMTEGTNDFAVYPNPATSSLTISGKGSSSKNIVVKLIDANGKIIKSSMMNTKLNWSVSGLVPGVYYVVILDGGKMIRNKKVVIER